MSWVRLLVAFGPIHCEGSLDFVQQPSLFLNPAIVNTAAHRPLEVIRRS